jgi:hypothetical protein
MVLLVVAVLLALVAYEQYHAGNWWTWITPRRRQRRPSLGYWTRAL